MKKCNLKKQTSTKNKATYSFGDQFINPYIGNKITEVLNFSKKRVGWIWETTQGKIVVSPHLGLYLWFGENGKEWTVESGANWLCSKRS